MLSFFSVPKPFEGHIGIIQKNAIESWRRIHPTCEVLLFGDEPGVAAMARECGLRHIPEVIKNEFNTPLLHKVFLDANRLASHKLICYVNADIIILKGLIQTLALIHFKDFLVSGQRWNLDLNEPVDFNKDKWNIRLEQLTREKGLLESKNAIDYFLFPRDSKITEMPAFAVGRPGWDSWLIFRARQLRMPVIDATASIYIIHQNHDYTHVPERREYRWDGPEADHNRNLMGDPNTAFTLLDATHIVKGKHIKFALSFDHLRRLWQKSTVLYPNLSPLIKVISKMINLFRFLKTKRTTST